MPKVQPQAIFYLPRGSTHYLSLLKMQCLIHVAEAQQHIQIVSHRQYTKVFCTEISAITACYPSQDTREVLCAGGTKNIVQFVYQSVQTQMRNIWKLTTFCTDFQPHQDTACPVRCSSRNLFLYMLRLSQLYNYILNSQGRKNVYAVIH